MNKDTFYIFDFDSTLVTIETLDELIAISLANDKDREAKVKAINAITDLGMAGEIGFNESLSRRLATVSLKRSRLEEVIALLATKLSPSAVLYKDWFKKNKERIFVVSGGFEEYIKPTVALLGLDEEKVFANRFIFSGEEIVGFDKECLASKDGGKGQQVKELNLTGKVIVIGDGYTDYMIKEAGAADEFWAYTESVAREKVVAVGDKVVSGMGEMVLG